MLQNSVRGYFIVPTNYYFSKDQIDAIDAIFLNPPTGNAYADRDDAILSIIQRPDAFGTTADASIVAWFGAAAQANRGIGFHSDLYGCANPHSICSKASYSMSFAASNLKFSVGIKSSEFIL